MAKDFETEAQQFFIDQLVLLEPNTEDSGGYTNKPGGHNTRANNDKRTGNGRADYTCRDEVDRRGPNNKTSARDWTHHAAQRGDYRSMAKYGNRLKAAFDRRSPLLTGWFEALGQTDTDRAPEALTFRTWTPRVPDDSHVWHWHFGENRELVEEFLNKLAMLHVLAGGTEAQFVLAMVGEAWPGTYYRNGSAGAGVFLLQVSMGLDADGYFGPATESAVKHHQAINQLAPDGIVGASTWNAIRGSNNIMADLDYGTLGKPTRIPEWRQHEGIYQADDFQEKIDGAGAWGDFVAEGHPQGDVTRFYPRRLAELEALIIANGKALKALALAVEALATPGQLPLDLLRAEMRAAVLEVIRRP